VRRMVVDACVLINLLATNRIAEIAASNDAAIVIVREVADETFFLRPDNPADERSPVDLGSLCSTGTIEVLDLDEDELALFVAYAAAVDDGEAASIAVSVRRGLPLATDDRGALRLIAREGLQLELHCTTAIMHRWAATITEAEVAAALAAIEDRASFIPGAADQHHLWWRSIRDRGTSPAS